MRAAKALRDQWEVDRLHDAAWTVRRRTAGERAHAETLARFGGFTVENAAEAIAWQEARIAELMTEGTKGGAVNAAPR